MPDEQLIDLCSKYVLAFPVAKLFLKKIFIENKINYKEGLVCGEDHLLNYQYLGYAETISFIDEPLYRYYCFNSNGATRFFPLSAQIEIFKAKERFLSRNCNEKNVDMYCAKNALRNLIARFNYLAKRSIKDYEELGRAYDFYWPYIAQYLECTDVFEENDIVWLNKNKSLVTEKKIKQLYTCSKKEFKKKSKHIRNLKEFLDMPLKKKMKFIKNKIKQII